MNGADSDAGLALLCHCLRLSGIDRTQLMGQLAEVGWERLFEAADNERLGSALVQAIRDRSLAPPVPAVSLPNGRLTVPAALAQRWDDHIRRRAVLLERLDEVARALNSAGIVPLVLKGGRSLSTGGREWRSMRDLDLLVRAAASRAQAVARAIGYYEAPVPKRRVFHHHQQELYRSDLPGWIEIHQRCGPSRVEQFLASAELATAAVEVVLPGGGRVGILPVHLHILHGMLHHHIGHVGVRLKAVSPKGLFEFAAELASLDADEGRSLLQRASRHPRVLAIFELWCAAAADVYGLTVEPPLQQFADTQDWWRRMRDGTITANGARDELRVATSPGRMVRAAGGRSPLRRMLWRAGTPLTFFKHPWH